MTQADFVLVLTNMLADGGVKLAFLSPGYRNAPLALAVASHPDISHKIVVDERTAGFMALGAGKAGSLAICIATSGSAGGHYSPAVLEARRQGVPMIVITADRPPELHKSFSSQTVDQTQLFGNATVYRDTLQVPESLDSDSWSNGIAGRLALALHHAARGPVHLNIQLRKPLLGNASPSRVSLPTIASTRADITDLVPLLSQAHGLIIGGAADSGANAIAALSAHLNWPIIGDIASPARGTALQRGNALIAAGWRPPTDIALWFGLMPISKTVQSLLNDITNVIHVSPSAGVDEISPLADIAVPSSATQFCEQVISTCSANHSPPWFDQSTRQLLQEIPWPKIPWSAPSALCEIIALAQEDDIIFSGPSLTIRNLDLFAQLSPGQQVFCNRGLNGIDGTMATAAGLGIATGKRPLCLTGDIGFFHDVASLFHLTEQSMTVVIINNGGGRIFDRLPLSQTAQHSELFVTAQQHDIGQVAQSLRAAHYPVQDVPSLRAALGQVRERPGLSLIEVVTEASTDEAAGQHIIRHLQESLPGHG